MTEGLLYGIANLALGIVLGGERKTPIPFFLAGIGLVAINVLVWLVGSDENTIHEQADAIGFHVPEQAAYSEDDYDEQARFERDHGKPRMGFHS